MKFLKIGSLLNLTFFESIKDKKSETLFLPITKEQRTLIKSYFSDTNAFITYSGKNDDNYVLPNNVKANYGKGIISFYNTNGILKASVAYHSSVEDRVNLKAIPLLHYEIENVNHDSLNELKNQLSSTNTSKFKIK